MSKSKHASKPAATKPAAKPHPKPASKPVEQAQPVEADPPQPGEMRDSEIEV